MDVLKDESKKSYPYISRYSSFPFFYNIQDKKFIYGMTSYLSEDTTYVAHTVTFADTLDSLALKYYGRPDLYWIIADFNRIQDPYINLKEHFKTLKIPSLSNITFKEQ